ncbi:O-antigen polysaccharide polymerase Wzy family protein [Bradyrhizobium sp. NC92]|uniref:O-antigen polysaccharide polymerase Wzy family protein n=1 Tax=Bradyrhizobium sp. (strain NC92) TaxID=55395 RepID=UPI0021AA4F66|nr:O-antigen polysaccharide polymerase Wzy family protein [Bradyrhizobium sp. NC92]UWU67623.1 O-antigen polysaccharide polymerase Wzy family protein [Bradyrhizobium sp. NC92]
MIALAYAGLAALAWLVQAGASFDKPILVPIVTAAFAVHALARRRDYSDPVIFFVLVMAIYSLLPLVAETGGTRVTLGFVLRDAFGIYNWANLSTLVAAAVCFLCIKGQERSGTSQSDRALSIVAVTGATASLLLSATYVARNGIVLGGDVSYAQGFEVRLQAGTGFLLLSIPLAIAAYAAALIMKRRKILLICFSILSILVIAIALGQRKYFLQVFLFAAGAVWRPRRAAWLYVSLAGIAVLFVVFSFLGYLRIQQLPISSFLVPDEWERFFLRFDQYLGNETVALYSTSAAATTTAITPLPYLGDYSLAWQLLIPQFLFKSDFIPLNARFGYVYNPAEAVKGAGWGFSFIGEAYLVGGYFGITFVILFQLMIFRLIYLLGNRSKHTGMWGVVSLCSLYFALWTQRNAFAYLLREFTILLVVVVLLFLFASLLVSDSRRTRGAQLARSRAEE